MCTAEIFGMTEELSTSQIEDVLQAPLALPGSAGVSWKCYLTHPENSQAIAVYFSDQKEFICFPNALGQCEHIVTSDPRVGAEFLYREHRPRRLSVHLLGELNGLLPHS
jgi:hypothetical protein